eukprot:106105_1
MRSHKGPHFHGSGCYRSFHMYIFFLIFMFIIRPFHASSRRLLMHKSHVTAATPNVSTTSNTTAGHCCVCFTDKPFATFNEGDFRNLFLFYCPHASINVCKSCWIALRNRYKHNVRCPLCRASRPITAIQPGYIPSQRILRTPHYNDPFDQATDGTSATTTRTTPHARTAINCNGLIRRCDFNNGLIAAWLIRCTNIQLLVVMDFANDFWCCRCMNLLGTIIYGCGIGVGVNTAATALGLSTCFCCDCCHFCFPDSHVRYDCVQHCDSFDILLNDRWLKIRTFLNKFDCDLFDRRPF